MDFEFIGRKYYKETMRKIEQNILYIVERISKKTLRSLRRFYYSRILKSMGKGAGFGEGVCIIGPENIILGNNVNLNNCCLIEAYPGAEVHLENNVSISYRAQILTRRKSDDDRPRMGKEYETAGVVVGESVVIAAGAIIQPGVRIGKFSFVAPGSVVTHDVPPYTLVSGVPAKVMKEFIREE